MEKSRFGLTARTLSFLIALQSAFSPPLMAAAQLPVPGLRNDVLNLPPVAPGTLPKSPTPVSGAFRVEEDQDSSRMVIRQESGKIVIDWQQFDIGEKASVHFDQQQNVNWAALNRIHDQSPSQILGSLTADGRVFLINQNGILFGDKAQVNVHSLTASSLNIGNQDFLDGRLDFRFENYSNQPVLLTIPGPVVNQGVIASKVGGKIFLFGGDVTNQGTLSSFAGQIGLAAGEEVSVRNPSAGDTERVALGSLVEVSGTPGNVMNAAGGLLEADFGLIGLYGDVVVQDGTARASTSPQKRGAMEVYAASEVSFGTGSWTGIPVAVSDEKLVGDMLFGKIKVDGLQKIDEYGNLALKNPLERIVHRGMIDAPGGSVTFNASDRIYLDHGARIDVSGLWTGQDGASNGVELQLTSDQLKDVQGQSSGILKGANVRFLVHEGTSIGNVSSTLNAMAKTPVEMSVDGGTIELLTGPTGDLIVREGALLNIAGGGIRYGNGMYDTTKLLSGGRIYDISSAPEWLKYDKILGNETIVHKRFGVTKEYKGLYYGGAAPMHDYVASFVKGGKAGSLATVAGRVVFEGNNILSSMTVGEYQTLAGMDGQTVGSWDLGKRKGNGESEGYDPYIDEVVIGERAVSLGPDFNSDSAYEGPSLISAEMIEASSLRHVNINAAKEIKVASDAGLRLPSAGSLSASARRIEHYGAIEAPGGTVELTIRDNRTSSSADPGFTDIQERIYLGSGSRIDVSGEKIDNRRVGEGEVLKRGVISGGTIALADIANEREKGAEVVIPQGAVLDVSGGYEIQSSGTVKGGDAGTISLTGATVVADGTLKGLALQGRKGGTLAVHADEVAVIRGLLQPMNDLTAEGSIPDESRIGKFILGDAALAESGITTLELKSLGNLAVTEGVRLEPSAARLENPVGASGSGFPVAALPHGAVFAEEGFGLTGTALAAGVDLGSRKSTVTAEDHPGVIVGSGAEVLTGPGGSIRVAGPQVTIGGTLSAPAGKITVTTAGAYDLTLESGSRLLAQGINRVDTGPAPGAPMAVDPVGGGDVILDAGRNFTMAEGAVVDVSGSEAAETMIANAQIRPVAAGPGNVSLTYKNTADLGGEFLAGSHLSGLPGGSIHLLKTGLDLLSLTQGDFTRFAVAGFDDLSFGSLGGIELLGSIDAGLGRRLVLDTPYLKGGEGADVRFRAPWLRMVNTLAPAKTESGTGEGKLSLSATWIDVAGDIRLDGFGETRLQAERDLRFSDYDYKNSPLADADDKKWAGRLETGGDLTLQAGRIFTQVPDDHARKFAEGGDDAVSPAFTADYAVRSAGRIVTEKGMEVPGNVPSGGGSLTLEGDQGIEHRGVIEVPLGTVTLKSENGSVRLAPESRISVAGEEKVHFGTVRNEQWFQTTKDKSTARQDVSVENAPEKGVTLVGDEVVVSSGAQVDLSGGGSLFGYQFQPGMKGTINPLAGKFVIVRDEKLQLPGKAIYLQGVRGVPNGVYSVLPEEYAFREDAYVLVDLEKPYVPGGLQKTEQGYDIVGGYETFRGTAMTEPLFRSYAVRKAADVMEEGEFARASIEGGSGGSLTVDAARTTLNGSIHAKALEGFAGGSATLLARENLFVRHTGGAPLPEGTGGFNVDGEALSAMGFDELRLGIDKKEAISATNVAMEEGSRLSARRVVLGGTESVHLKGGSGIDAGVVEFDTPDGKWTVEKGATIHASDELVLATSDIDFQGDLHVDSSTLRLKGKQIVFGEKEEGESGLFITPDFWSFFVPPQESDKTSLYFRNISLDSNSDIVFRNDLNIKVEETLRLDAARIAGESADVTLAARKIVLQNDKDASADSALSEKGSLILDAGVVELGSGKVRTDGFASIDMKSAGDLTFRTKGELTVDGDLTLQASRVTVAGGRDEKGLYQGGDYAVLAGDRTISITGGGATPDAGAEGGRLSMTAGTINHGGLIDNNGGTVKLTATGSGDKAGVFLKEGGRILARGNSDFAGGSVSLAAEDGKIDLGAGSEIDVSAGAQGEAGEVVLRAPKYEAVVAGTLRGKGVEGKGGAFTMDTAQVSELSGLNPALAAGGFDRTIDLRARGGSLALAGTDTMKAQKVSLTADAGSIDVAGTIDASSAKGKGRVELNAGKEMNLLGAIRAAGTGEDGKGGVVRLYSGDGYVITATGSQIDVSGGSAGRGGFVEMRTRQITDADGNNSAAARLEGEIKGAERITLEAVQVRNEADGRLDSADINQIRTQVQTFMADAATVRDNLIGNLDDAAKAVFHLAPGVEVQSAGDLTLSSTLDLTTLRAGGEPGVLTLRAGRDLKIEQDLIDHPTSTNSLLTGGERDSWTMNLVAGADMESADLMSTKKGVGDLKISDGKQVYTESAPIRFASGRNMEVGKGGGATTATGYMVASSNLIRYNIGSWEGDIEGRVGNDLKITAGAIQTATGDIDLTVGNDVNLSLGTDFNASTTSVGSIRTLGGISASVSVGERGQNYYKYAENGGDIRIRAEGNVKGALAETAWDTSNGTFNPTWSASYANKDATEGLATLAGGNLSVKAGGDFSGQAGTFGTGDLEVRAGANADGRFLTRRGEMDIQVGGNFGAPDKKQVIELMDASVDLHARGDVRVDAVVNPTITSKGFTSKWNVTYSEAAAVRLKSVFGDVALFRESTLHNAEAREGILPPTLEIEAGRDIRFTGGDFSLVPSPDGNLRLIAARNIDGGFLDSSNKQQFAKIIVSDDAPGSVFGVQAKDPALRSIEPPARSSRLHENDPNPVEIKAGGDIRHLGVRLPKEAEIEAGGDIRFIRYVGQNLRPEDVSFIRAGEDIQVEQSSSSSSLSLYGIEHGGPGALMVQAGAGIDLGKSRGILAYGSEKNVALGNEGSDLVVTAGYHLGKDFRPEQVREFIAALKEKGEAYSTALAEGRVEDAQTLLEEAREAVIEPFFTDPVTGNSRRAGSGDLNMVESLIRTSGGNDDLYLILGGEANIGRSAIVDSGNKNDSGIATAAGGSLSIFAKGDINVNESRVMSFKGGDILVWSEEGDINAGRGSRSAMSRPPMVVTEDEETGELKPRFSPPQVGSGIRALTFDPDGVAGSETPPLPGNIYLIAPSGIIDAGEAGIAGGKLFLAATEVLNAQNISFSLGSVGVPSSDAGAGLGALAGVGSMNQMSGLAEDAGALGPRQVQTAAQVVDSFMAKWLDVEVIGFEVEDEGGEGVQKL